MAPLPGLPESFNQPKAPKSYLKDPSNANSVPKNYCYGAKAAASFDVAYCSHSIYNSAVSSRQKYQSFCDFDRNTFSENEATSSSSSSFRRNPVSSGFSPAFPAIPSIESDNFEPEISVSRGASSVDVGACKLTQSYFDIHVDKPLLSRQHCLVADDRIIDVAYDSDVGWTTTNVRTNPYKSSESFEQKVSRERRCSRDSLKLDLRHEALNKKAFNEQAFNEKALKNSKTLEMKENCEKSESTKLKEQLEGSSNPPPMKEKLEEKESSRNVFEKCRSTISATSDNSFECLEDDEEIVDDVFDAPDLKTKKASKTKARKVRQRRSSGFEALSTKSLLDRNSSVSINDKPEYFDATKPCKIASSSTHAKSSRGSLKKSSTKCSDYDRDRGRSRHMESGHRESFKKNDRTNERGSEQDSSDRELKGGSLNRSLSNNDTNLEDRIGL